MITTARSSNKRLARLEAYLAEDPRNPRLLADACEEAIAAGEHARAGELLRLAEGFGLDGAEWALRRAHLAIAQQAWAEALVQLDAAQGATGEHPVIAHDRAWVRFRLGEYEACRSILRGWLEPGDGIDPTLLGRMQQLWLRATHHQGLVREAFAWASERAAGGRLAAAAFGPASLVAVDAGDFSRAKQFADAALASAPDAPEALVARASVAVAERDNAVALQLLRRSLQTNASDGRTWSTLGLASLGVREYGQARIGFQQATRRLPGHIGGWHGLGWACLLLQDRHGALAAFEQALTLDRNFAESHGAMGLALHLLGRPHEADRHIALAERLDRHNVTGRYARAVQRGEVRDAEALHGLAARLLDRPGLFGGSLKDDVQAAAK